MGWSLALLQGAGPPCNGFMGNICFIPASRGWVDGTRSEHRLQANTVVLPILVLDEGFYCM